MTASARMSEGNSRGRSRGLRQFREVASIRRGAPRRGMRLVVVLVMTIAASTFVGTAHAAPSKGQLEKALAQAQEQAETATEAYLAATGELDSVKVRVEAAELRKKSQEEAVAKARHTVSLIAAESYRNGDLIALEVLLGDNPDALLIQQGMMTTLADRQEAAISELLSSQEQLEADRADLLEQQKRLTEGMSEVKAAKKEAEAKDAVVRAQISRFNADEFEAWNTGRSGVRAGLDCDDLIIVEPNATAGKVIDYACSKLGSPYLWGATGPNSFDCSGLTLAAYKAAGITLPRIAADQSHVGRRISMSEAQPGDLVFYRGSQSPGHVAIYIGDGLRIHAPHTGDHVRIATVRESTVSAVVRVF
jgi:peptidoglycan DL-endopeptidase CwlO